MKIKHVILVAMLGANLGSYDAMAHGDDKPGPHNGVIRMPGPFHTELVSLDQNRVAVYLLDIEFKEPTTEDSSVKVVLQHEQRSLPMECKTEKDHFICTSPMEAPLNKGTLEVAAKRKEYQGVARYPLPVSVNK